MNNLSGFVVSHQRRNTTKSTALLSDDSLAEAAVAGTLQLIPTRIGACCRGGRAAAGHCIAITSVPRAAVHSSIAAAIARTVSSTDTGESAPSPEHGTRHTTADEGQPETAGPGEHRPPGKALHTAPQAGERRMPAVSPFSPIATAIGFTLQPSYA